MAPRPRPEPSPPRPVGRRLTHELLQSVNGGVSTLALAACIRIMDEHPFPYRFKMSHKQMVNNPITELRREDLPVLVVLRYETERRGWTIAPVGKLTREGHQVLLGVEFELQGRTLAALVATAVEPSRMESFKRELRCRHLPERTAKTRLLSL